MEKTVGNSCPFVTSSCKSFASENYFLDQMKLVGNLRELLRRQMPTLQNYYPNVLGC